MTVHVPHPRVPHPNHLLPVSKFNDWVARKLTRILGSAAFFYACFTIPLIAIPAPLWFKALVAILSSNWVQLWALAVLQMGQNKADDLRKAMADAGHQAQSHIANTADATKATVDEVKDINAVQDARLARIEAHLGVAVPDQPKEGA